MSKEAIEAAIARINGTVQEVELDKVYQGKVKKIMDYGAFVEIIPGVEACFTFPSTAMSVSTALRMFLNSAKLLK
ncbi:MAG: S1 RNA-binding domain-containing protein [Geovibrio sp.]|nr:S1 RNA-binding domain-containing protein [Geovibrio sp.]